MNISTKIIRYLAVVFSALAECAAANNAPPSFPTSIVKYTFTSASQSYSRIVLYDASGVYTELSVTGTSLASSGVESGQASVTAVPHHGIYSYSVDPQNSDHATIVYDGEGAGTLPIDELYFVTASTGSKQPPSSVSIASDVFTMFPMQDNVGATNVSSRSTITAGGEAITGFVIGGTKTTWVLVRAVGTGLTNFGVSPTVAHPTFTIYDDKQKVVGNSSPWGSDVNLIPGYKLIAARVGAFPLSDSSDEGILMVPLAPGAYTAVFRGTTAGEVLSEIYILPFAAEISY